MLRKLNVGEKYLIELEKSIMISDNEIYNKVFGTVLKLLTIDDCIRVIIGKTVIDSRNIRDITETTEVAESNKIDGVNIYDADDMEEIIHY